jgi:hypothetical protein
MNTVEIEYVLKKCLCNKMKFIVCSADQLLKYKVKKPSMFIVNIDQSDQPGSHWVSFYFPESGAAEFFDSMGKPPEHYHIYYKNFLIAYGSSYLHNLNRIQDYNTSLCGEYCIYFLIHRSENMSYEKILVQFCGDNYFLNDYKIMKYFKMLP